MPFFIVIFPILLCIALWVIPGGTTSALTEGRQTYTQAMDWYREGAEAGDPKAQFYYGLRLQAGIHTQRDLEAAARWFRKAGDGGYPLAHYKLAVMLQFGRDIEADPQQARKYYRKAANHGIFEANYNLATMLQEGSGGEVDMNGAAAHFEEAARGGVTAAFLDLAILFARGEGIEPDLIKAMKWVILAENHKVKGAADASRLLRERLSAEDRRRADVWAKAWE